MARQRRPVSLPGKGSQRTDLTPQGAAGSKGQPVRVAPGQPYGDRQKLVQQQQAAPLATGAVGAPAGAPPGAPPGPPGVSAFRPTDRPGEPIQTGIPFGPGAGPIQSDVNQLDAYQLIQVLARKHPSAPLMRLMAFVGGQAGLER